MIRIEITSLTEQQLSFSVTNDDSVETCSVELDEATSKCISSIMAERPFKNRDNEAHSWLIIGAEENNYNSEKRLLIEIRKGKSRLKRKQLVSKHIFYTFWNILFYKELPHMIKGKMRSQ